MGSAGQILKIWGTLKTKTARTPTDKSVWGIAEKYQSRLRETIQGRTSMETLEESEYEDGDVSEKSDPSWIQDYNIEDSPEDS